MIFSILPCPSTTAVNATHSIETFPKGPNILLSVFAQIKTAFTLADQNHTYRHISFKLLRDLLKEITLTLKYLISYTTIHFIYAKKKITLQSPNNQIFLYVSSQPNNLTVKMPADKRAETALSNVCVGQYLVLKQRTCKRFKV